MTEHKVAVSGILKKNDHTQGGHIMDYSIIGFPRIGIHRELKFATEAYFRSEIEPSRQGTGQTDPGITAAGR